DIDVVQVYDAFSINTAPRESNWPLSPCPRGNGPI
ncbi:MAG: hypothetical protein JWR59_1235, partial [Brevundimonas sp.]|nr:hypothetical protein [Brevundimonas sp.]